MSYPPLMQGIQIQPSELGVLHDQTLMNRLNTSSNRSPASSLSQFYHEISKQSTSNADTNSPHNQYNRNDNITIRSLPNSIEII